jgi:phosphatidate phosphatase PAH1
VVVKWDSGQYFSTPFLVSFGAVTTTSPHNHVRVYINNTLINHINFSLDNLRYVQPMKPSHEILKRLHLNYGINTITFELDGYTSISSEIYLFHERDRILVSDMDGTLTKDDIGGLMNNLKNKDYLHDGYYDLINTAYQYGYKIVWLTMRSLPLYAFSKEYIRTHTQVHGVLLM